MKAAIRVLSDLKDGTEEAFGRVFNALAAAYDFKKRGDDRAGAVPGEPARWVGELIKVDHPAHALFEEAKDTVEGTSSACATAFGATEAATRHGFRPPEWE
jgi:hypothetical protein